MTAGQPAEPIIEGKLSLILPALNEAPNLERVVGHSIEVLNEQMPDWEIIVVNDGSTDETGEIADQLSARDPRVRVVHHLCNRGYGAAWRSGFGAARGEYLMCMDSDGQFDLADISQLLPYVNHYDIVAGYRIERQDPAHRKVNAKIFHAAARVLFGISMRDLDCAFKIFRASLIHSLPLQSPGALINLEIFTFAAPRQARVMEVGVHHYPRQAGQPSGAKLSVVLQAMREILVLRLRVWQEGFQPVRAVQMALATGAGVTVITAAFRRLRRR
ncbi:MAG: glycosyltransferase family 2 protein [Chloroflexota bacterium]|nr:glycosyltransferase family 2 protein [Chloroflexota bacterium]